MLSELYKDDILNKEILINCIDKLISNINFDVNFELGIKFIIQNYKFLDNDNKYYDMLLKFQNNKDICKKNKFVLMDFFDKFKY